MRIDLFVNFHDLIADIQITLIRVLLWSFVSWVGGISVGLFLKRFNTAYKIALYPVNFVKQISPFAWMPLAIIICGLGESSIAFVLIISMLLPSILMTVDLLKSLSKEVIEEAKLAGAHGWDLIWHIELPLATTALINQYRFLWSIGWNTVIAAEMLGVSKGLGFRLLDYRYLLAYKEMLVYIFVIGFIGIISDAMFRKIASIFEG